MVLPSDCFERPGDNQFIHRYSQERMGYLSTVIYHTPFIVRDHKSLGLSEIG